MKKLMRWKSTAKRTTAGTNRLVLGSYYLEAWTREFRDNWGTRTTDIPRANKKQVVLEQTVVVECSGFLSRADKC